VRLFRVLAGIRAARRGHLQECDFHSDPRHEIKLEERMRIFAVLNIGFLALVLGLSPLAFGQQDQPKPAQEQRPTPHETPHETKTPKPARPAAQEHQHAPQQASHAQQQQQKQVQKQQENQAHAQQKNQQKQQENAQKQQQQAQKQAKANAKQTQKQNARRAQNESPKGRQDQREIAQQQAPQREVQRSSHGPNGHPDRGARIPEARFHEHFGHEHRFAIRRPVIVDNEPRFQYSGYWFEIVDPWPAAWSYDDDCYIDYVDDGYYLFDPLHPGIRIAVVVVE
jgi:DNA polymerase III gamma/tau subunit